MDYRYAFGFHAGPAVATQDLDTNVGSGTGLSADLSSWFYLAKAISAGFVFNYERRSVDVSGTKLGDLNTFSMMPSVLFQKAFTHFAPYGTVGVGLNVNQFSEASILKNAKLSLQPSNPFAFRLGGGFDYLLNEQLSLNFGASWKLNSGSYDTKSVGNVIPGAGGNFKASSLLFALGLKYFM